jgi:hypothetical protein
MNPPRDAFPLLGTLATGVISVLALAVSLWLNHPELLDSLASGGALLAQCLPVPALH